MLIEINFKRDRTNAFKTLKANPNFSPVEKLDKEPLRYCIDCGISSNLTPVTYNGYCIHCATFHRFDNY